ncbi:MAG TPA: tRNA (guanosine(46)-N7)-methyltransferase TrmB [Stellaceae bacterium]|nr:tRNA (guanosine(46)-N7)-methyltransferase TrmB [Stellaceae bacterium]
MLYGRRRGRRLRPGQRDLFASLLPELRIDLPEEGRLDPQRLFPAPPAELWLEIGFGAGEHLAEQAAAHPEVGLLGAEVFENGVVKLLAEVRRRDLGNIRILVDDARLLLAALPDASLGRVFILFPDPWPKARHHKRRMVSPGTLDQLARTMKTGAELRLATDDIGYLRAMLELVPVHPAFTWEARGPADWLQRPADWPATRYEAKAVAAGRIPHFLRCTRKPR